MYQKALRKSPGLTIGTFLKGWSSSRSLSPVMMHKALQNTANSRNLLSFGSRHSVMLSEGEKKEAFSFILSIVRDFSLLLIKYRSNFFLCRTSVNSWKVVSEKASLPVIRARSNAWAVVPFINDALTRQFVSKTNNGLFFIIQNILENFFSKSSFLHFITKIIQESEKFLAVRAAGSFRHKLFYNSRSLCFSYPGSVSLIQGAVIFNFYHNY